MSGYSSLDVLEVVGRSALVNLFNEKLIYLDISSDDSVIDSSKLHTLYGHCRNIGPYVSSCERGFPYLIPLGGLL